MEQSYNDNKYFKSPRVKMFYVSYNDYLNQDAESLEQEINEWLKTNEQKIEVVDIKYTTTYDGDFNGFSACIFYNLFSNNS